MSIETGGPAFPLQGMSELPNGNIIYPEPGMTLRDWFAGQALAGLVSIGYCSDGVDDDAIAAYELADAMLKARSETHE